MQSLVGSRPLRALPGMAPSGSASPALATPARLTAPMAFPAPLVCCNSYSVAFSPSVALERRCSSRLRHPCPQSTSSIFWTCSRSAYRYCADQRSAAVQHFESASSPPTCGTLYADHACGVGTGRMTEAQVTLVQRATAVGAKRLKRWHPAAAARATGPQPQEGSTPGPAQAALQ